MVRELKGSEAPAAAKIAEAQGPAAKAAAVSQYYLRPKDTQGGDAAALGHRAATATADRRGRDDSHRSARRRRRDAWVIPGGLHSTHGATRVHSGAWSAYAAAGADGHDTAASARHSPASHSQGRASRRSHRSRPQPHPCRRHRKCRS